MSVNLSCRWDDVLCSVYTLCVAVVGVQCRWCGRWTSLLMNNQSVQRPFIYSGTRLTFHPIKSAASSVATEWVPCGNRILEFACLCQTEDLCHRRTKFFFKKLLL